MTDHPYDQPATDSDARNLRAEAERLTALAEAAAPHLLRHDAGAWLARLDAEVAGMDAALTWIAALDSADDRANLFARLVAALWPYWWHRQEAETGQRWLGSALERTASSPLRAALLFGTGVLAFEARDIRTARISWSELLGIGKEANDPSAETLGLAGLSLVAHCLGDPQRVDALGRASLARAEAAQDQQARALALLVRGRVLLGRDDAQAADLFDRAAQFATDAGLNGLHGYALIGGAFAARGRRDGTRASILADAARATFTEGGDTRGLLLCARYEQADTDAGGGADPSPGN